MDNVNLTTVLEQVCKEKNISQEVLIDTVEQAVLTAAKRVFPDREIEPSFENRATVRKIGSGGSP